MYIPKVAVLFGFGINCDHETAAVFEMVGAQSERVHVNLLVQGERHLSEFDILAVPGGFSFGDHLGSGRLLGNRLRFALREQLQQFVKDGKPCKDAGNKLINATILLCSIEYISK